MEREFIRYFLNNRRFYVDLLLNIFSEALLLPFIFEEHSDIPNDNAQAPMKNVIKVLRQWITKDTTLPLLQFLSEPGNTGNSGSISGQNHPKFGTDPDSVNAGMNNFFRVFIFITSNVFLLEVPPQEQKILELQVDICKRVLNIYRYMVMKIELDRTVW